MMSKKLEMQKLIRHYKEVTGETAIDMKQVARFAVKMGWPLPIPKDAFDMLAEKFTDAAREDIRKDKVTGSPYRGYHALPLFAGAEKTYRWVDIDEATRLQMWKSLTNRREQMVSDGAALMDDTDHWNRINPSEKPIQMEMDLTLDIEWRRNGDDDEGSAGGGAAA